ncbi:hypothetical protein DV515_00014245 [Chloebia gouldiae]|uniref:Uncharacterized protein n=1 Tax=Chloebia gouldiae TaxID=44316 RepID=A0A3L8S070_CHLGU|nr:hypothetical protein DV515_00014245 [Chloebia gouldiae]
MEKNGLWGPTATLAPTQWVELEPLLSLGGWAVAKSLNLRNAVGQDMVSSAMETVTDSPQDPDSEGHFQFRVILLGDTAVGKSSLLRFFADRPGGGPGGAATPSSTVSVEFYSPTILMPTIGKAKLQLWDMAGQERFSAAGVLLVFDLTNQSSFEHVPEWYHKAAGDRLPAFVLVGHKCDLVAERAMSAEEATTLGMAFVKNLSPQQPQRGVGLPDTGWRYSAGTGPGDPCPIPGMS